jgi:hypothetical protein
MEKLQWSTVQRRVRDLVPLGYNPRKLTIEKRQKLLESLEKFDLVEIPVINTDNVLVAGNQRVEVMMDLGRGDELIDVRMPNRALTEKEIKEYNITSNTHVGIWDVSVLEEVFADIDLPSIGLDVSEIPEVKPVKILQTEEDNYEVPEDIATNIVAGDLIEFVCKDGRVHRLLCGDSTNADNVEKLLTGAKPNLMVTDPPYGVNYDALWRIKSGLGGSIDRKEKVANDNLARWGGGL